MTEDVRHGLSVIVSPAGAKRARVIIAKVAKVRGYALAFESPVASVVFSELRVFIPFACVMPGSTKVSASRLRSFPLPIYCLLQAVLQASKNARWLPFGVSECLAVMRGV